MNREEFESVDGRIIAETRKAYKIMTSDLDEFWVPKSVSQNDGVDGLVVRRWFIDAEGLPC
jgi:RNase P/RNase MRP subunit p29